MGLFTRMREGLSAFGLAVRSSAAQADRSAPTITSGTGAPTASEPQGSVYIRTDGAADTGLYIATDSVGTWAALSSAAGAVLDVLFDANTILKADTDNTPAALTVAEDRVVGRIAGGVITALTAAQVNTLLGTLLATGAVAGSTSQAQSFGATGIKSDVIAEHTAAAGVTADSVLLKDGSVTVGVGGQVVTDTIAEKTAAAGVTIDGALIKDGQIQGVAPILADTISEKTAAAGVTVDSVLLKDGGITLSGGAQAKADTIVEATADAGVSIESVLLKDGALQGSGNPIKVNNILEFDAATGVTVDGTLIKDGGAVLKDSTTQIVDDGDPTKKLAFETSTISAGQTRTITAADRNVNLDYAIVRVLVTIATAAVKTLNATPVQLVPAPGAGRMIEFVSAHLWLDFATVAYDAPNAAADLAIRYTDGSGAKVATLETAGFIDGAADEHRIVLGGADPVATAGGYEPVANAALMMHNVNAAEYATGDSPLKVEVFFRNRALEPA